MPQHVRVKPGKLTEGRARAEKLAAKTGQPVSLLQPFYKTSRTGRTKMVWTRYDTVYPYKANPRVRKTRDYFAVEGNYGYGWEEVTAEDHRRDALQRLKEYRENDPQHAYRLKSKREKIETTSNPRHRRHTRRVNPRGSRYPDAYSTQIDTSRDFHTLTSREVEQVLAEADAQKYRKPKNASGSRARYFYAKLQREAARGRRGNPSEVDPVSARELELYIENDGDLHRRQGAPINKNLITKMARGVYHHAGAVKLFGYLMESGAKKYAREFGGPGASWHQMFSPATRKAAAERFADHFEVEAKLGNYDHLLPKKYADWRLKKNPNRLTDVLVKRNGRVFKAKAKYDAKLGRVRIFANPRVARAINPSLRFRDLPIGSTFRFSGSNRLAGGGRFLGQNEYKKAGSRSYIPADIADAERSLLSTYSGYPDILKKLKGARLRKSLTLKVGSVNAAVERT